MTDIVNAHDALRQAVSEADELDRAIARQADTLARLVRRRLRYCSPCIPSELKRDLRDFDAHLRKWKDRRP